jgi:amidase
VASGDVRPLELATIAADAVRAVDPRLSAVIEVFQDRVDEFDETSLPDGPFRGVTFSLRISARN